MRNTKNLVGQLAWIFSLQYYVIQAICAVAWDAKFSWRHNTISDLGNTVCGQYADRIVCSPLHSLMNASLILLGVTTITGAIFIGKNFSRNRIYRLGFALMFLSGIGTIIVGLFPENTISNAHITGAAMAFIAGNLGMIIIGSVKNQRALPTFLRIYSICSGFIGIVALTLFANQSDFGLGIGTIERLASYPQSIWMFVVGAYLIWAKVGAYQQKLARPAKI